MSFARAHGRNPSTRQAADSDELVLARWLARQRTIRNRGSLSPLRIALLDGRLPGWEKADRSETWRGDAAADRGYIAWQQRLREFEQFVRAEGRYPSSRATDDAESRLGYWLVKQRRLRSDDAARHTALKLARLDELFSDWRGVTDDERFERQATALASFVNSTGRLPRLTGENEERALATWLNNARQAAAGAGTVRWTPERAELLNSLCPSWRGRQAAAWRERAEAIAEFYRANGRNPSRRLSRAAPGADTGENTLAVWRNYIMQRLAAGTLPDDIVSELDSIHPHWRSARHSYAPWAARADAVAAHVARHGGMPVHNGPTADERSLYRWVVHQRYKHRRGALAEPLADYLTSLIPDWATAAVGTRPPREGQSNEALWKSRAEALVRYLNEHGRMPSARAGAHEHLLYSWWSWQRSRLRSGKLGQDRIDYLDAHLPEGVSLTTTRGPDDGRWEKRADDVSSYISINGASPSPESGDAAVRSLAYWLRDQRRYYRAGTLSENRVTYLNAHIHGWRGPRGK